MMSKDVCPKCGRPLQPKRFGISLTPLKASIVDMVQHGGEDGFPVDEIFKTLFRDRDVSRETLKTHVWQINELLADEGYKIVVVRDHACTKDFRYSNDRYRLIRIPVRRVA